PSGCGRGRAGSGPGSRAARRRPPGRPRSGRVRSGAPGPPGAASVVRPIRLARGRVSRTFTFRSVTHQLQQVTVGIEKVEAIVVAPVDRGMIRNAMLGEERLGGLEVVPADLEGVVALAERTPHLLEIERRAIRPKEQRA